MLHSDYKEKINLINFAIEIKKAFQIYPQNIVLEIANSKVYAEKSLEEPSSENK